MIGLEPQINIQHLQKAAQQQSRANKQHARQRNFGDHQRAAHPLVLLPSPVPGPLSLSASCRLPLDILRPGARPKKAAATIAIKTVQASAAASIRILPNRGSAIEP